MIYEEINRVGTSSAYISETKDLHRKILCEIQSTEIQCNYVFKVKLQNMTFKSDFHF